MASMAEEWYASNSMVSEPPMPCEFKVKDLVKFTNDYGVEFGPYKILGYTTPENVLHGRFIHVNSDSPWFPVKPEQLTRWPDMRVFEVTFDGFDPLRDDTDHLVKWISAENEEILSQWLVKEGIEKVRDIRDLTERTKIGRDFLLSQGCEDTGIDLFLKVLDGVVCFDGDYVAFRRSIVQPV